MSDDVLTNPYRRWSKRYWRRQTEIERHRGDFFRDKAAALREIAGDVSALLYSITPKCPCQCHADDDHCETCCQSFAIGFCPDCLDYMKEPLP
jgi:hypothetical protein